MSYIGSTPTTQSFIAGTDYFNGNGSTVNFTLSRSVNSVNDIEVIVNNVEQIPSGYSVSGTTLTFSAAPSAGTSNVYVRYLSTTNLSLAIPAGTSATFNTVTVADGSATTPSITNDGDTNTGIFFPAADTIAFAEGGAEAARFDSAGNLLVGTSTTGSAGINLSLTYNIGWGQGAGESIPNIFRQSSSAATVLTNGYRYSATANGFASSYSSSWAKSAIALNDGSVRFYTDTAVTTAAGTDVTPTERMRINSSGNVGIGTSSPAARLEVVAGTGSQLVGTFRTGDATAANNAGGGFEATSSATAGSRTARLWLDADGANFSSSDYFYINKVGNSGDVNLIQQSNANMTFETSGTERVRIESGGNINLNSVVYGNTTVNAANMFVNSGPVYQIYRSTSSAKYKTNVEAIEDSYSAALLQCRPVWFRSLCSGDNKEHGYWGFIAEEVAAIDPRLVFWTTTETVKNENGESTTVNLETPIVEGVQYDRFVPHLLNLIKKQNETIAALTTRITALENNNATQ